MAAISAPRTPASLRRAPGFVGALPGESWLGAAEVAVGRGRPVDRAAQVEAFDDAARRQRENGADQIGHALVGNGAGAETVDHDRNRLGHADGVSQLHFRATRKARGHDILGDVARHVAGGAVHLGRILAGKRAAAVTAVAAVGVHDDLAAGEAGVAHGAADDEAAGGIDVELGLLIHQRGEAPRA